MHAWKKITKPDFLKFVKPTADQINGMIVEGILLIITRKGRNKMNIVKTTEKADNMKMEKKAIFQASLKLLNEGKFHATPLAEIAYQANLSSTLILFIFHSREDLLRELAQCITAQITITIEMAVKNNHAFRNRFFDTWMALYKHYTHYPHVIAFIEQFENLKNLPGANKLIHPGKSGLLIDLFKSPAAGEMANTPDAEMFAYLFHANVLSAAKLNAGNTFVSPLIGEHLAKILWNGFYQGEEKSRGFAL